MRRVAVKYLFIAAILLALTPLAAAAQTGGPFAPKQPAVTAETPATKPGIFARAIATIIDEQRRFHRKLAAALQAIRNEGATAAAWTLIVTSFLYGVFHAAGPGHGKAILTAYLATHRERMLRGILLSAAAAAVQGLVAILLVFSLTMLAGWAARDTQGAVRWAEQLSFALVALLGGYLVFQAARGLWRTVTAAGAGHHHPEHEHCGHDHIPAPDKMAAARDIRTMAGVVLSIGIRPCSGAVLVLAVANVFGIVWAGIAAVAAMSFGTAVAVATLALVVLSARQLVVALVKTDSTAFAVGSRLIAFAGGAVILTLGLTLLAGSFGPAHPLGL